ncbi:MAG: hypothetical protein V3V97_16215 [Hyphomicrobiaceae bacterium]
MNTNDDVVGPNGSGNGATHALEEGPDMTRPKKTSSDSAPRTLGTATAARGLGLSIVRRLLVLLHQNAIAYCHWKSNEHVGPAVEGLTDLDILVDRKQSADLERIFAAAGFKRFLAPPLRRYPAIEDYLGFDTDSGRIVHLHLHYELTLGEPHLKGYRLPWESTVLGTRLYDPEHGLFVANPAEELVLLIVRKALKMRWRDWVRSAASGGSARLGGDFNREFQFLRAATDEASIADCTARLLGGDLVEPLSRVLAEPASLRTFYSFTTAVRRVLRPHRTFAPLSALLSRWVREAQWLFDVVNRRYFHVPIPLRRISCRGGRTIVLLGSDGAGKSSLSNSLVRWLGNKVDVLPIYFGSGDGRAAFYRQPLLLAHRFHMRLIDARSGRFSSDGLLESSDINAAKNRFAGHAHAAARVLWALILAYEKRGKIRKMVRARNRGIIVICDRFPQSQVEGFNDGPRLAAWRTHRWSVFRWLAAWESVPYRLAAETRPDLVIRLTVAPQFAKHRRPEMTIEALTRRVAAVQSLTFNADTIVADINADQQIDVVAQQAKEFVWDYL